MVQLIFFFSAVLLSVQCTNATICRSVRIHNLAEGLKDLENCTIVEGFVQIVLIHGPNVKSFEPTYRLTRLREITEYLLVHQIQKLRSIGELFPNLERIGGRVLFSQASAALVIADVLHLEEVGLYSLREISRGSVAIVRNPNLCYVNTIDWKRIMKWDAATTHIYNNSGSLTGCPACPNTCPQGLCWNNTKCQIVADEHTCHPLCAGGCRGPAASDCYSCRTAMGPGGSCVEHCPPNTFQLLSRCVSREECINYWHVEFPITKGRRNQQSEKNHTYAIFKDKCVKSCPAKYELNSARTDCLECPLETCDKSCVGGIVNSIQDAHRFRGCTFIRSSIGIHISNEFTQTVREELEESLGSIKRINGYLKVARSSITDLNFFKNLSAIDGNDTNEKYALFVVDNPNIQELWDWSTKKPQFTINGRLFFHYNPKLCLQKIYTFLEISGYKTTDSDFEIGKGSNGDKIPCNTTKAVMSVVLTSFDFIRLRLPRAQDDSLDPFRYVVYYTKDTFKNMTMFEDLNPCSDNAWRTVDKSDLQADDVVTLTDLEPDTQYVCYFTTYGANHIGARSEMYYVSTLPAKPSELTRLKASSNSSSEIYLQWEPPEYINGKLKEYIVTWFELPEDDVLELRDYCTDPIDFSVGSRSREIKTIKAKNTSNDLCCPHKPVHIPKEGFVQLCKHFDKLEYPISFSEKLRSSSCEQYFSSYVFQSPFRSESRSSPDVNRLGPNMLLSEDDERDISELTFLSKSTHPRRKTQQESRKVVSGNASETVLSGLKHFSTYAVTVKACRVTSPQEVNPSEENTCSNTDISITRTLKSIFADNITSVNYTVTKQTVKIFWKRPKKPNGLLLAFEIQFKRIGHDNDKNRECIRYFNNDSDTMEYSIRNMPVGKYEFRIRAVTLSGKGLFTNYHFFEVFDGVAYSVMELVFLIVLILIFVPGFVVLSHCLNKQRYKAVLVTDCNPNYHYVPDPLYEIPREDIEFGAEIGEGMFGKVYKGVLKPDHRECAIKTMVEGASLEMEREFLREAELMKSLNRAYFVVKLLGVVSIESPPLVLMELMSLGDLKNYLRSTRDSQTLGQATMIQMAFEIADAMTFMEANKFVHRDLAARNCMVGEDMSIKVGDFGMARDVYEADYYRKTDQGLLPIRWMPPESLRDGEFTNLSDVWSYGVVLWEIVSKAEQPYQGLSNDQVLQDVIGGATLSRPPSCPRLLGAVMVRCWKHNPQDRLNFMQIMMSLGNHHKDDEQFKKRAYFYTPEAEQIRNPKYVEVQLFEEPLLPADSEFINSPT